MIDALTAPKATENRILDFSRSEMFERTFREGMGMVEETAAYLDGPGRALSKRLARDAALAYAGESMRLTTRLMQVASWLLVQRAVREGEMTLAEAQDEKYRFTARELAADVDFEHEEIPPELGLLSRRCASLYARVRRLDERMYGTEVEVENPVSGQVALLQAAFGAAG